MSKTSIEWTDVTWNPVRGCSRISEGCRNCYAERQAARFVDGPFNGFVHTVNNHPAWTGKVELVEKHLRDPLKWRKPCRVFVNSMSDLFHENLSDEAIDRVFAVMALCPQHTFQILTKRPKRMLEYWRNPEALRERRFHALQDARVFPGDPRRAVLGNPSRASIAEGILKGWRSLTLNIWLGVSVEDRATLTRVDDLRPTPAAVRFLSLEPLLEDIGKLDLRGIDWVIVGGESGPGARPFDIEWARSVLRQCADAGVAVFVKQLGANPFSSCSLMPRDCQNIALHSRKGGDMEEWPVDLRVREFPEMERRARADV